MTGRNCSPCPISRPHEVISDRNSGRLENLSVSQPVIPFAKLAILRPRKVETRHAFEPNRVGPPTSDITFLFLHLPNINRLRPLIRFRLFHHRTLPYVASCRLLTPAPLICSHPPRLDDRHASQPFLAPTTPRHQTNVVGQMTAARQ